MFKDYYTVAGDFLIKYCEPQVVVTNGIASFSTQTEEPLVIAYLKQDKENTEVSTVLNLDGSEINLSFNQVKGKIKLNRVSLMLTVLPEPVPLLPWVSAMDDQIRQLRNVVADMAGRIERQGSLLDEMTKAKQENQNELLKRVYTLVNGNIKQEGEVQITES